MGDAFVMSGDKAWPSSLRRFEVMSLLDEVERQAERVQAASRRLDVERAALHAAMRAAYLEGVPVARVARAAGMTRQRASVVVRRR
jgi:hypothetical protein